MTYGETKAAAEVAEDMDLEDMLAAWEARLKDAPEVETEAGVCAVRHIDRVPPFTLEGVHGQVKEAREQVREWTRCIIRRACAPYSLALLGVSGCGKTHLARLARAALLDAGVECQLWTWGRVLDAVRAGNRGDMLRQLDTARVLMLDDIGAEFIGTEKALDFSLSELGRMLDARAGRWTLLTSNLLLHQIGEKEARCASRLLRNGGRVVQLDQAEDFAVAQYMAQAKKK